MFEFKSVRGFLFGTAAMLALPVLAHAQAAGGEAVDEVVVTGQRAINQQAIAIRRSNVQLVDSATADEIGKLPDFNAGDALKRLPGVSVNLYQGEPRFVSIRGLNANYTTVTIDGLTMATPDSGGRQVYMEVIPSDLASHIDVTKTSSADVDGHGLGGIINFVTASAFDQRRERLFLAARGGQNLQAGTYGGRTPVGDGEARISTLFGPDKQFGFAASATYWRRDLYIPQITPAQGIGFFDNAGVPAPAYGGNGYQVPLARQWFNYRDDRQRAGASARLDWRPSEALSAHVTAFYYWQNEKADRNDGTATIAATGRVSLQTPTTGQLTGGSQYYQLAQLRFTRELYGVNGELTRDLAGGVLDLKAGWSRATLSNPQQFDRYNQAGLSFNYDIGSGLPVYTATNLANYNDLSRYTYQDRRDQLITLDQDVYDLQASYARNTGAADRGFGFKFGGRWVRTAQDNLARLTTYTRGTNTLADVASGARTCSIACNQGGLVMIDPAKTDQFFAAQRASLTAVDDPTSRYGGTYSIAEDIYAGFGMLQYAADWGRIVGGLRYESTRFASDGYQQAAGVWQAARLKTDYGDLLPSLTVNVNTGAASVLRLAASRTLGRPRYDAQATKGGILNTGVTPFTLSRGNPDLKPLHATNYDATHEWYFANGRGILSIGVFYKEISDAIFTYGQTETLTVNGVQAPVFVTQARNTDHGVNVKGLEIGFTRDFDFLPAPFDGLGITGNATFSKAKFPITLGDGTVVDFGRLPQQANQLYNLALYYEKGRLHAKAAWNHTGRQWDDRFAFLASQAVFYQNRFVEPLDYLDISASYDFSDNLSANFSVLNVTGEDVLYSFGRNQEAIHDQIGFAPSVMFGVTFKH